MRRLSVALGIGLPLAFLAAELGLRWLLFSGPPRGELARALQRPERWAADPSPDYWKLVASFDWKPRSSRPHPLFDEELGWRSAEIDPETRAHADEAELGERRPVLLYGDSFAQCVARAEHCWQDLLAASDLGAGHALLNYGVGGYGLDQMYLLYRASIERHAARDPIVIVAILVDDDLDRCGLELRNHPKPRFELRDGELVLDPVDAAAPRDFVALHPVGITSYALRLALGPGPSAAAREAHRSETAAVCTALIERWEADLGARGLEHFFVLFHGRGSAAAEKPQGWQEALLLTTFERLAIPFVSSRRWLRADAAARAGAIDEYYFTDPPGENHWNDEGNRVVFEALRSGLKGEFDEP